MHDARGVVIHRGDLLVWFGKIARERASLHIGIARGAGIFSNKIRLELIMKGDDEEWGATEIFRSVRADRVVVVEDVPESPYER